MLRRFKDVMSDWAEVLTDRAVLEEAIARLCPGEFTSRQLEEICSWCARQSDTLPDPERSEGRGKGKERDGQDPNPYISLDGHDEREVPVAGKLDPPDDALLLLLASLKHGVLSPPGGKPIQVEHLVVDEAQDLSAIELKVLLTSVGKLGSVTLAGDVSQRLTFDNAFTDWESLLESLGAPIAANTTLKLGYRSTEQIMALARFFIGRGAPARAASPARDRAEGTSGTMYEWKPQRGDQGEAVAMLAEALRGLMLREPLASVACITRYPEQARSYASALTRAEVPGVRLVANQEFSFKPGIEVTDVTQVKGLEFDYVVLLDVTAANYPDTQESRHMLYIGATRSAHQLWLISPGRPSALLPEEL
jgi:DNA helicase-2/ATP-dependent DNA helicase PcrA